MNPRAVGVMVFGVTACMTLAVLGLTSPALIALGLFGVYTAYAVLS